MKTAKRWTQIYDRPKICPNCGDDLDAMHPEANLWPHFIGTCKALPAREPEPPEFISETAAKSWASGVLEPHRTAGMTINRLRSRVAQLEQDKEHLDSVLVQYVDENAKLFAAKNKAESERDALRQCCQTLEAQQDGQEVIYLQLVTRAETAEKEAEAVRQERDELLRERDALREAAKLALIPLAALVLSGECVDAPSALTEEIKQAIVAAHDAVLAALAGKGVQGDGATDETSGK